MLSDGDPTASYRVTGTATGTCFWEFHNAEYDESTVKVNGCYYNMQEGNGGRADDGAITLSLTCEHGETATETFKISHSYATIWEAQQAANDGMTVFSIALQAGTTGENVLRACATDATKDYYAIASADNVEETLTTAFTSIAGSIAIAARQGVVNDPMGENVQLNFSGSAPVITTDKAVYDAGHADVYISQGTATYDAETRAISWTVGNVREGDNPIMKYKVGILDGYNPSTGDVLDTNKRTTSATLTTSAMTLSASSRFRRSP